MQLKDDGTFHFLCMLTEAVHSVCWEGLESPPGPACILSVGLIFISHK